MKFIVLALLMVTQVMARTPDERKALLEAQTTCGNFVQFDENYLYQGFGNYKVLFEEPRSPIPGIFSLTSFDNKQINLETLDSVLDVAIDNASRYFHAVIIHPRTCVINFCTNIFCTKTARHTAYDIDRNHDGIAYFITCVSQSI